MCMYTMTAVDAKFITVIAITHLAVFSERFPRFILYTIIRTPS